MRAYLPVMSAVLSVGALSASPAPAYHEFCDTAQLSADVNGDCVVNPLDSGFILARFGCPVGTGDPDCDTADTNGDGEVNPLDSGFVLARFCGAAESLPLVDVDAPESPTSETLVTLAGTSIGAASVEIAGGVETVSAAVVDCIFAIDVELHPNSVNDLFVTGIADDGTPGAPTPLTITHDTQPPFLFIDFPADGAELTTETTDVAGRVSDLLSGFLGLTVQVNGVDAVVDVGIGTNGTFLAMAVPLAVGENTIAAVATDAVGNEAAHEITINRIEVPPDVPQMTALSGNNQTAQVDALLAEPIVVEVLNEADGAPFGNKVVTFEVTRSDGRLSETNDGSDPGGLTLQVHTDENGLATAFWTLGTDAGCGNNRITVTSSDIAGSIFFCASATPGPAAQINIGSGNNQRAEVNSPAPEPLEVWVSDSGNGVSGVSVTFTVTLGGGTLDGQDSITVLTGATGHAEVAFLLGPDPGNNLVEADFPSNPAAPAAFNLFGIARDEGQPTSFAGIVLDNGAQPIQGATCTLDVGDLQLGTESDVDGQFHFDDIADSGPGHLFVDASTAFHIGGVNGMDVPLGTFPSLSYAVVLIPNAANSLATPVLLPPLNPANQVEYDGINGVELTVEGVEGLKFIVADGTTVTLPDGTIVGPDSPGSVTLSLNQVHQDDIPMPIPNGAAPPFAWTLQPAGATFDPPVEIVYPNMSGLAAGAIVYFLSFNHDTGTFEIVATGSVTDDGSCIITDPGSGLTTSGWGGPCPPYPITGSASREGDEGDGCEAECDPDLCQVCVGKACVGGCDPLACQQCVDGECVLSCTECQECVNGECLGGCDPLACQECVDGGCVLSCDDVCQMCEGGACVDTCTLGKCLECMNGACVESCDECSECFLGECVSPCDEGACELCVEGACVEFCPPSACQECVDGGCQDSCDEGACQGCEDGACMEFCPTSACQECLDGICEDSCDTSACQSCTDGVCESSCSSENCESCVDGSCEMDCDADACEVCFEGSCLDFCPTSACQECVNGNCENSCDASACQICSDGVCEVSCDDNACEACFDGQCEQLCAACEECEDGVCVETCQTSACQECVNGVCESSCDDNKCETCVDGACTLICNFDTCEECFNGICKSVCNTNGCQECVNGICETSCDADFCEECGDDACVSACSDNECQFCLDGVCESTCDDNACETCFDGACASICDANACQVCVDESCLDTCPKSACQVCVNGVCETSCDENECEQCVGGVCESFCLFNECEFCLNGVCGSMCSGDEICVDGVCE